LHGFELFLVENVMLGFVPQPNLRGDAIALGEVVSTQVVLQGFSVTVDELLG